MFTVLRSDLAPSFNNIVEGQTRYLILMAPPTAADSPQQSDVLRRAAKTLGDNLTNTRWNEHQSQNPHPATVVSAT